MILGYEEARQESGRFYEYEYLTIVTRKKESENFGCFKGKNNQIFSVRQKIYCWSDKCFDTIIAEWERMSCGLNGIYSYTPIGKTSPQSFTPEQVVEAIYKRNNFKYLANLITLGGIDVIM
jgi:hypothetical protein